MAEITSTARFRKAKRDVVASLDPVFPGVKELSEGEKPIHRRYGLSQNRYMSSLPLQMFLFFHVSYFPIWLFCTGFLVASKFNRLELEIYQVLFSTILIAFASLEVGRLYLGYLGNLAEKVPELSGFWLLTMIQLPVLCFYTFYPKFRSSPFEQALNLVLVSLLFAELVGGYEANKALVKHQLHKFHLLQFTERGEEEEKDDQPETLYPQKSYPQNH